MDMYRLIQILRLDGIVPESTIEELKKYANKQAASKLIFQNSPRIGEFYENYQLLQEDFEKTSYVHETYRYGFDKPGCSTTARFSHPTELPRFYHDKRNPFPNFLSIHDFLIYFYDIFKKEISKPITGRIFGKWLDSIINRRFKNMDYTYELIHFNVFFAVQKTAAEIDCTHKFRGAIRRKHFLDLQKKYFGEQDQDLFNQLVQEHLNPIFDSKPFSTCQIFYKKLYEEIIEVFEKASTLFEKYKASCEPSKNPLPIIRCVYTEIPGADEIFEDTFYFQKEVLQVVKSLRADFRESDLGIKAETWEERKLGFVHLMNAAQFCEILEKYKISRDEYTFVWCPMTRFVNQSVSPIISNYGTFCKPAVDAFKEVMLYLLQNLQLFYNMAEKEGMMVFRWIRANLADFLVESDRFYAIEVWRIDEICAKAKKDLRGLKKPPKFIVPSKKFYEKSEMLEYVQKYMWPLELDKRILEFNEMSMQNRCPKPRFYQILYWSLDFKILKNLGKLERDWMQQLKYSQMRDVKENGLEEESRKILLNLGNSLRPFFNPNRL
ncbi:unnamed protein product [Caenorhabditis angaria]|uniref:Uncharacterized protein n=1 Tax=Caenorhabditis angaria TaxID=860376 RepID=A0A9P1I9R4_9PELO|nr:unnamed protein product [Caenorhabditis angaria]